jgi:hypothetical protein
VDVVLVVRVLAAVAIVVSVCCGTTALIERGRVPRCVYAALPAYTQPIVRLRGPSCENAGGCVNAHPGVYTRESAFTRTLGAYMQEVCLRTRVRIREIVRIRERGVRKRTYPRIRTRVRIRGWLRIRERWVHLRGGCVYASGCVYAGRCVYASGSTYTQRVRIRTPSRIHRFLRIRTPVRVNTGNDKP